LYEITDKISMFLRRAGFPTGGRRLYPPLKYGVLGLGVALSAYWGVVAFSAIYPPAIIGRELYYAIAINGFGAGATFFAVTVLFDLFVSRRGFCRYLCPGGALYSILGRFRVLRIQRQVKSCNDCTHCDQECQFGLHPMSDGFGQECNNCTACIAVCPTDALQFVWGIQDQPPQGHGHLGPHYQRTHSIHPNQKGHSDISMEHLPPGDSAFQNNHQQKVDA
ncbi:MAG: (4Fe-4S)-binding protein, partial [Magnetococcales bacterium]|nr:(4Fe-4S)-binding protein [Magnetococcales bacterium]